MSETEGFPPDSDQAAASLAEVLRPADPKTLETAASTCTCHSTGTNELDEYRAALRRRIDAALQDSMDRCARCKACDYQVDAVMAVLDAEPLRQPPGMVPVSREDLRALLDDWDAATGHAGEAAVLEAHARLSAAAGEA